MKVRSIALNFGLVGLIGILWFAACKTGGGKGGEGEDRPKATEPGDERTDDKVPGEAEDSNAPGKTAETGTGQVRDPDQPPESLVDAKRDDERRIADKDDEQRAADQNDESRDQTKDETPPVKRAKPGHRFANGSEVSARYVAQPCPRGTQKSEYDDGAACGITISRDHHEIKTFDNGKFDYAWIQLGYSGTAPVPKATWWVRAATRLPTCPLIKTGQDSEFADIMTKRVEVNDSDPLYVGKGSDLGITLVCQYAVQPEDGTSIELWNNANDNIELSLPTSVAQESKVIFIGDTGKENPANDDFKRVANKIDDMKNALTIHLGDFLYGKNGKETWSDWDQEFFAPAKGLLEAGRFLFVRGNKEQCKDEGSPHGWFYFFDPSDRVENIDSACSDRTKPYIAQFAGFHFAILDSAKAKSGEVTDSDAYRDQLAHLNSAFKDGNEVFLLTHRPFWSYINEFSFRQVWDKNVERNYKIWIQNVTLQSAYKDFLAGLGEEKVSHFRHVVSGHQHLFDILHSRDPGINQVIIGNSGQYTSSHYNHEELGEHKAYYPRTRAWWGKLDHFDDARSHLVMRDPQFSDERKGFAYLERGNSQLSAIFLSGRQTEHKSFDLSNCIAGQKLNLNEKRCEYTDSTVDALARKLNGADYLANSEALQRFQEDLKTGTQGAALLRRIVTTALGSTGYSGQELLEVIQHVESKSNDLNAKNVELVTAAIGKGIKDQSLYTLWIEKVKTDTPDQAYNALKNLIENSGTTKAYLSASYHNQALTIATAAAEKAFISKINSGETRSDVLEATTKLKGQYSETQNQLLAVVDKILQDKKNKESAARLLGTIFDKSEAYTVQAAQIIRDASNSLDRQYKGKQIEEAQLVSAIESLSHFKRSDLAPLTKGLAGVDLIAQIQALTNIEFDEFRVNAEEIFKIREAKGHEITDLQDILNRISANAGPKLSASGRARLKESISTLIRLRDKNTIAHSDLSTILIYISVIPFKPTDDDLPGVVKNIVDKIGKAEEVGNATALLRLAPIVETQQDSNPHGVEFLKWLVENQFGRVNSQNFLSLMQVLGAIEKKPQLDWFKAFFEEFDCSDPNNLGSLGSLQYALSFKDIVVAPTEQMRKSLETLGKITGADKETAHAVAYQELVKGATSVDLYIKARKQFLTTKNSNANFFSFVGMFSNPAADFESKFYAILGSKSAIALEALEKLVNKDSDNSWPDSIYRTASTITEEGKGRVFILALESNSRNSEEYEYFMEHVQRPQDISEAEKTVKALAEKNIPLSNREAYQAAMKVTTDWGRDVVVAMSAKSFHSDIWNRVSDLQNSDDGIHDLVKTMIDRNIGDIAFYHFASGEAALIADSKKRDAWILCAQYANVQCTPRAISGQNLATLEKELKTKLYDSLTKVTDVNSFPGGFYRVAALQNLSELVGKSSAEVAKSFDGDYRNVAKNSQNSVDDARFAILDDLPAAYDKGRNQIFLAFYRAVLTSPESALPTFKELAEQGKFYTYAEGMAIPSFETISATAAPHNVFKVIAHNLFAKASIYENLSHKLAGPMERATFERLVLQGGSLPNAYNLEFFERHANLATTDHKAYEEELTFLVAVFSGKLDHRFYDDHIAKFRASDALQKKAYQYVVNTVASYNPKDFQLANRVNSDITFRIFAELVRPRPGLGRAIPTSVAHAADTKWDDIKTLTGAKCFSDVLDASPARAKTEFAAIAGATISDTNGAVDPTKVALCKGMAVMSTEKLNLIDVAAPHIAAYPNGPKQSWFNEMMNQRSITEGALYSNLGQISLTTQYDASLTCWNTYKASPNLAPCLEEARKVKDDKDRQLFDANIVKAETLLLKEKYKISVADLPQEYREQILPVLLHLVQIKKTTQISKVIERLSSAKGLTPNKLAFMLALTRADVKGELMFHLAMEAERISDDQALIAEKFVQFGSGVVNGSHWLSLLKIDDDQARATIAALNNLSSVPRSKEVLDAAIRVKEGNQALFVVAAKNDIKIFNNLADSYVEADKDTQDCDLLIAENPDLLDYRKDLVVFAKREQNVDHHGKKLVLDRIRDYFNRPEHAVSLSGLAGETQAFLAKILIGSLIAEGKFGSADKVQTSNLVRSDDPLLADKVDLIQKLRKMIGQVPQADRLRRLELILKAENEHQVSAFSKLLDKVNISIKGDRWAIAAKLQNEHAKDAFVHLIEIEANLSSSFATKTVQRIEKISNADQALVYNAMIDAARRWDWEDGEYDQIPHIGDETHADLFTALLSTDRSFLPYVKDLPKISLTPVKESVKLRRWLGVEKNRKEVDKFTGAGQLKALGQLVEACADKDLGTEVQRIRDVGSDEVILVDQRTCKVSGNLPLDRKKFDAKEGEKKTAKSK